MVAFSQHHGPTKSRIKLPGILLVLCLADFLTATSLTPLNDSYSTPDSLGDPFGSDGTLPRNLNFPPGDLLLLPIPTTPTSIDAFFNTTRNQLDPLSDNSHPEQINQESEGKGEQDETTKGSTAAWDLGSGESMASKLGTSTLIKRAEIDCRLKVDLEGGTCGVRAGFRCAPRAFLPSRNTTGSCAMLIPRHSGVN